MLTRRAKPLPAETAISFHFFDTLVHGWDLASAIGYRFECSAEIATLLLRITERIAGNSGTQASGTAFSAPLAADPTKPDFDCALALLGRDPEWAPSR